MQESQQNDPCSSRSTEEPLPVCCGTGCVVCVLDYPELYESTPSKATPSTMQSKDSEMMAMLEAFEQAEAGIVEQDSKS
jgi:hypothetical protein